MELFIKGSNPENQNIPYQRVSDNETLIRKDYYKQTYLLGLNSKFKETMKTQYYKIFALAFLLSVTQSCENANSMVDTSVEAPNTSGVHGEVFGIWNKTQQYM